jgi:hypothetical protein
MVTVEGSALGKENWLPAKLHIKESEPTSPSWIEVDAMEMAGVANVETITMCNAKHAAHPKINRSP